MCWNLSGVNKVFTIGKNTILEITFAPLYISTYSHIIAPKGKFPRTTFIPVINHVIALPRIFICSLAKPMIYEGSPRLTFRQNNNASFDIGCIRNSPTPPIRVAAENDM